MKRNLLKKLLTPILVAGTLFSTPALANQPQHTYTPGECITYRLENFDGTLEEACVEPQHDHPSQTSPESLTERFVLTTDIPETETTPKYEIFTAVKKTDQGNFIESIHYRSLRNAKEIFRYYHDKTLRSFKRTGNSSSKLDLRFDETGKLYSKFLIRNENLSADLNCVTVASDDNGDGKWNKVTRDCYSGDESLPFPMPYLRMKDCNGDGRFDSFRQTLKTSDGGEVEIYQGRGVKGITERRFDRDGRVQVERFDHNSNGTWDTVATKQYHPNGQMRFLETRFDYNNDGVQEQTKTYTYNPVGIPIKRTFSRDKDGDGHWDILTEDSLGEGKRITFHDYNKDGIWDEKKVCLPGEYGARCRMMMNPNKQ